MKENTGAKVITVEELEKTVQPLPQSWVKAAGLLRGKKKVDALSFQRKIRVEWEKRFKKLSYP